MSKLAGSLHSDRRVPTPALFTAADFARAKILVGAGAGGSADLALALDFLRRLLPYTELLQTQRSALRASLRALVDEREGRLCYRVDGESVLPMRPEIERAVRSALDGARPGA